ncbi:MAG: 50S ribosomal protein L23 [Candidatus Buchananbacteria bacterium]|jgi:large subunit ribosomal protein L23
MGLFDKKTAAAEEKKAKTPIKKAEKVVVDKIDADVPAGKQGVYGVLISPLITEKSTKDEQHGKYAFAVTIDATKSEIIKAVMTRYGIKPVKVNVLNRMGKVKRFGKSWGKRKDWRKAVITLPKGKSINVYEAGK